MAHAWSAPLAPISLQARECTACGLSAAAETYRRTDLGTSFWGVAWRRGAERGLVDSLRGLPACAVEKAGDVGE